MASTKDFLEFVLEQTRSLNLTFKPMMGEFLLYLNGTLIGGIYDNRLLIKITNSNSKFSLTETIPYQNAKPMYQITNLDDIESLTEMIVQTYNDLTKKA